MFLEYSYGAVAITIISLLAFVGLFFFPMIGTTKFLLTMQFHISLGEETMSGDVIFYIIPNVMCLGFTIRESV